MVFSYGLWSVSIISPSLNLKIQSLKMRFMRFFFDCMWKSINFGNKLKGYMKRLFFFLFILTTLTLHAEPQGIKVSATDFAKTIERGEVFAIKADNHKHVWIATYNGLVCFESGAFTLTPVPSLTHHPFPGIRALEIDPANDWLWIGSWNHLYCYDLKTKRFITIADSLIYQTVRLKCDKPGEVLAYTQHGLYLEQLSDSFPEGHTVQINQKAYEIQKPLTRQDVENLTPLNGGLSSLVAILAIVLFTILTVVFALIYKKRKLQKTEGLESSFEKKQEEETKGNEHYYNENFAERAERVTDKLLSDETFSIERLAQELAVSRAQLFRKMKTANGMTPSEFITHRRMVKAEYLLNNTDLTIADIATKVGISDVSNFRRTYIKTFGHPPVSSHT